MDAGTIKKVIATSIILIIMITLKRKKKFKKLKKKRIWVRNWIKKRNEGRGVLNMLNNELRIEDLTAYKNFLRMDNLQFEYLLAKVVPIVDKKNTTMRECISSRNK